jgi:hypothetical protein
MLRRKNKIPQNMGKKFRDNSDEKIKPRTSHRTWD